MQHWTIAIEFITGFSSGFSLKALLTLIRERRSTRGIRIIDGSDDGTIQIFKTSGRYSLYLLMRERDTFSYTCVCSFSSKTFDFYTDCKNSARNHVCNKYNAYGKEKWNPPTQPKKLTSTRPPCFCIVKPCEHMEFEKGISIYEINHRIAMQIEKLQQERGE